MKLPYCFCMSWKWPLVWRKDAERQVRDARNEERRRVDLEMKDERAKLQQLMKKVVEVGERQWGMDGTYEIRTSLNARMFQGIYDREERAYFAEYVGREVEANVAQLIVVNDRHRMSR